MVNLTKSYMECQIFIGLFNQIVIIKVGDIYMDTGAKIKKLRKKHKDTLKQLAHKLNYDYSNLSKVERGIYNPSLDLLQKITEVYEVSPTYFFGSDFTESESHLLLEDDLSISKLRDKYIFKQGDFEATEDEIKKAIGIIRMLRSGGTD